MKYLILAVLLSGCATYRYNEGQIVKHGACVGVIDQILANNGYLLVGCGPNKVVQKEQIAPLSE